MSRVGKQPIAVPSGPTRVNEKIAVSAISTLMIGTSAAISAGTCGLSCGAVRRSAAIRAATPSEPLTRLARYPTPAARNSGRRPTVAPVARTHTCHASVRAIRETS